MGMKVSVVEDWKIGRLMIWSSGFLVSRCASGRASVTHDGGVCPGRLSSASLSIPSEDRPPPYPILTP